MRPKSRGIQLINIQFSFLLFVTCRHCAPTTVSAGHSEELTQSFPTKTFVVNVFSAALHFRQMSSILAYDDLRIIDDETGMYNVEPKCVI